jgi:circadian clock protein KaiB
MIPSADDAMAADQPGLILFITGDAPRSRRARANLAEALQRHGQDPQDAHEIDLVQDPAQTFAYGIFATPALLRTGANGRQKVLYGDLSERRALERFLELGH